MDVDDEVRKFLEKEGFKKSKDKKQWYRRRGETQYFDFTGNKLSTYSYYDEDDRTKWSTLCMLVREAIHGTRKLLNLDEKVDVWRKIK